MHSNTPLAYTRSRVLRLAILALAILAAPALVLGDEVKVPSALEPTAEPAPQIKSAVDGVIDLFKQKQVVALGDAHGLAQEEAFYSALVRDPRFAEQVGNVVVEFGGSEAQATIDRYVNGEDVPFTELRHVWTDLAGWLPGPFFLGYINFFANVRAANLKLPAEHRIKIWLGEPKIDWTKINSFQDLEPIVTRRQDNILSVISEEILKRQKKALLIIGSGHLVRSVSGPGGFRPLSVLIDDAYPNALAVVWPFTGYSESECNAKFVVRAKDWPVPAVVGPIEGTWLKSELLLPGCNYIPLEQIEQMKKQAAAGPPPGGQPQSPGKRPSLTDRIAAKNGMQAGVNSDAILYLGPPDGLTQSPIDSSIYLDPDYFKEMNRRARFCLPKSIPLDWDEILQQNSVVPKKFQPR